ncbi:MAG: YlcI/YnfO family protein [Myxococcota bacterium]
MKNLQAKNVPDSLHKKATALASRRGVTLSQFIVEALEREIARDTFTQRLAKRSRVALKTSPRAALEEEREAR